MVLQVTLEALRTNKKLTQVEASELIGVSLSTLQSWEAGKTYPKQPQIERICEVYGVTYDNIFFG